MNAGNLELLAWDDSICNYHGVPFSKEALTKLVTMEGRTAQSVVDEAITSGKLSSATSDVNVADFLNNYELSFVLGE